MTTDKPLFHQRQRMTMVWVRALAVLFAALAWGTAGVWLWTGEAPAEAPSPDGVLVVMLVIFGILLPWFLWTIHLRVGVFRQELVVVLWPIWRRRVPLAEIESATPVTYHPIRDFLGWGLRWSPGKGWAMTVSGNRGVQLELRGGRRLLIGSNDPEPLAAAIESAAASRSGGAPDP